MNFFSMIEGWHNIKSPALLAARIKAGRPLARTDEEKRALAGMENELVVLEASSAAMRERLGLAADAAIPSAWFENYYCGPVLHNRFQIVEKHLDHGKYIILDHEQVDGHLRLHPHEGFIIFSSIQDAKSFLDARWDTLRPDVHLYFAGRTKSSSPRKATAIDEPATTTTTTTTSPQPQPQQPRQPKTDRPTSSSSSGRKLTPAKMFHQLLTEQPELTDAEIYGLVKKEFPAMSYRPTYPAWYRKQLP